MKRDDFLTTPQAWTRTGREVFDPQRYGCSVEGFRVSRYDRWVSRAFAVAVGVGFAVWLVEALV